GTAFTQAKSGIENYNLLSQSSGYVWMPVAHYQSAKGIYAELRYNYENIETVSFYGGKRFEGGKAFSFALTPMAGISFGRFSGVSLATNAEAEWKKFYLSSQTQYSMATKPGVDDFFFSWSEIGYNLTENIFGGAAIQYTLQQGEKIAETGFVVGLSSKNLSIPVYVFSPFKMGRYFVVGLNYEFDFKKKR
ncbi:MAG: hypothetical protein SGI96_10750, partial [Bacteroidota bacterium]|nr:hypothetical protein [Bacteroidota bacterium]